MTHKISSDLCRWSPCLEAYWSSFESQISGLAGKIFFVSPLRMHIAHVNTWWLILFLGQLSSRTTCFSVARWTHTAFFWRRNFETLVQWTETSVLTLFVGNHWKILWGTFTSWCAVSSLTIMFFRHFTPAWFAVTMGKSEFPSQLTGLRFQYGVLTASC